MKKLLLLLRPKDNKVHIVIRTDKENSSGNKDQERTIREIPKILSPRATTVGLLPVESEWWWKSSVESREEFDLLGFLL